MIAASVIFFKTFGELGSSDGEARSMTVTLADGAPDAAATSLYRCSKPS